MVCKICGTEFLPQRRGQKTCSEECRAENKRRWQEESRRRKEEEMRKKNALWSLCDELARYNRENGTNLSYGQYVMKMGY